MTSFTERYGPWAVVAGGSEGVGSEFAVQLAEAGINSVLVARKPEPLADTAQRVRAVGGEARTVAVDLTEPSALDEIRAATDDLNIGLYIHNAGANTYGHEFISGDLDQFQKVIDLNITSQLALVQHFGQRLAARGCGGILLVGSLAGYRGSERISIYAAAKAFGRVFAEGLWLEMRQHGVDVLELVLGVTRTPAMARIGYPMDTPGVQVSEPADVAREGLAHLADGPVHVITGNERAAAAHSSPDRRRVLAPRS